LQSAIDLDAPTPGFFVLADQYSPGWRETVPDLDLPIRRANRMFYLIEVPVGRASVEFVTARPVSRWAPPCRRSPWVSSPS
jgi:hypothetical protein